MIRSHSNWIFAGVFYDIKNGLRQSSKPDWTKCSGKRQRAESITLPHYSEGDAHIG